MCVCVCVCADISKPSTVQSYKCCHLLQMPMRQILHLQLYRAHAFWGFIPSPTVPSRPHSVLQESSLGVRRAHLRSKLMSETAYVTQGCGIGNDRPWPSFQLSLQLWILMLLTCDNFPCPFLQPQGTTFSSPVSPILSFSGNPFFATPPLA